MLHKLWHRKNLTGETPDWLPLGEVQQAHRWCFDSGGSSAPAASAEEKNLNQAQADLLREQIALIREQGQFQDLVGDILLEEAGFQVVRSPIDDEAKAQADSIRSEMDSIQNQLDSLINPTSLQESLEFNIQRENLLKKMNELRGQLQGIETGGDIIGIEKAPLNQSELNQQTIERLFQERTLAALKGELPVDPALERELSSRREVTFERLRKQLGPGFETSTPGIEAIRNLTESDAALRDAARRGDLTLAEQLGLAQGQFNIGRNETNLQTLLSGATLPLQTLAALQGGITGAGNIAARLGQDRLNQAGINAQNAAVSSQNRNAIIGGIGTLALAAAVASSKNLKENNADVDEDAILDALTTLDVEYWNYINDIGKRKHIGPYAEDFQEKFGIGNGRFIEFVDAYGVLFAAVKSLAAKVERLENGTV